MIWGYLLSSFTKFMLTGIRMAAFVIAMPLLGGNVLPSRFKAGLALLLTLIVFNFVQFTHEPSGFLELALLAVEEVMLGLLLGFVCSMIFSVFMTAGTYMGIEMGFRMVNVIDPYNASKFTLIDAFMYFFCILVFLTINGHHFLVRGIMMSFRKIPVGGIVLSPDFGRAMIENFTWMVFTAVLVAMPIVAAVLIVHVALGIVAKTAPKIPIFLLSFPIKIGLGLLMLSVIFPGIALLMGMVYEKMFSEFSYALEMLV